ncbi:MAG: hypothetical protein ACAI34_25290 [Verrucomicrobium sp.]
MPRLLNPYAFASALEGAAPFDSVAPAHTLICPNHLLLSSYAGSPVMRMSQTTGDDPQDFLVDILSVDLSVPTADILARYPGASNVGVTTGYDQTGNGRHYATASYAGTPRVITPGSTRVALVAGYGASAGAIGVDDYLRRAETLSGTFAIYCVCEFSTPATGSPFGDDAGNIAITIDSGMLLQLPGFAYGDAPPTEEVLIVEGIWNGAASSMRINGGEPTVTDMGAAELAGAMFIFAGGFGNGVGKFGAFGIWEGAGDAGRSAAIRSAFGAVF